MSAFTERLREFTVLALLTGATEMRLPQGDWIQLFNGRDLSNWVVKIAKHDVGDNFASTFRVENGVLKVGYDGYGSFSSQFGHLFYRQPFENYHLVVEYRFTGNWLPDTPEWARRNSGVMLHAQNPSTMLKDQDFLHPAARRRRQCQRARPRAENRWAPALVRLDRIAERRASHRVPEGRTPRVAASLNAKATSRPVRRDAIFRGP